MIENKRFQFSEGHEMNGFWIEKNLTPIERTICYRLATGMGILGWSQNSLNAGHFKKDDIDNLEKEGLVRRVSLIDLSAEILNNQENIESFEDLEETYGLPFIPRRDKNFYYSIIFAKEAVNNPSDSENQKIQTQVTEPLFTYLNLPL